MYTLLNRIFIKLALLFGIFSFTQMNIAQSCQDPMYFAIPADEKHFLWLVNLIGSIHKFHYEDVGKIAVFNLGLSPDQMDFLNSLDKVYVFEIERTNPDILTHFKIRPGEERYARGWYSWKPVVIKQALELFPYVLYLDSGITILGSLTNIFKHIQQQGYFLFGSVTNIRQITTAYVAQKLANAEKFCPLIPKNILDQVALSANVQGISRAVYKEYVLPVYELSKDIQNFVDDGTCPQGFGWGRCDQTLYSIYAHLLSLNIFKFLTFPGYGELIVDNKKVRMRLIDVLDFTRENIYLSNTVPHLHCKNGQLIMEQKMYGSLIDHSRKIDEISLLINQ